MTDVETKSSLRIALPFIRSPTPADREAERANLTTLGDLGRGMAGCLWAGDLVGAAVNSGSLVDNLSYEGFALSFGNVFLGSAGRDGGVAVGIRPGVELVEAGEVR